MAVQGYERHCAGSGVGADTTTRHATAKATAFIPCQPAANPVGTSHTNPHCPFATCCSSEPEKNRRRDLIHDLRGRREGMQMSIKRSTGAADRCVRADGWDVNYAPRIPTLRHKRYHQWSYPQLRARLCLSPPDAPPPPHHHHQHLLANTTCRDALFSGAGPSSGPLPPRETEATAELDNRGLLGLQQAVMRRQDEELAAMEKTVASTKVGRGRRQEGGGRREEGGGRREEGGGRREEKGGNNNYTW